MDPAFLNDYYRQEEENWNIYFKQFTKKGRSFQSYPSLTRFNKYQRPMAYSVPLRPPWVQIPFYGTTFLPIVPVLSKEEFEFSHGFSSDNIDRMIDFSKETGKIQFVLAMDARLYEKMDYIEPILCELKPPQLSLFSVSNIIGIKEAQKSYDDFIVLAGDNIVDHSSINKILKIDSEYAILIKEHGDPSKYGTVSLYKNFLN